MKSRTTNSPKANCQVKAPKSAPLPMKKGGMTKKKGC